MSDSPSPPPTSPTVSTSIASTIDPSFEERWNAWVARGHQHDLAVQRKLRSAAIAGIVAVALAIAVWRLLGGSL